MAERIFKFLNDWDVHFLLEDQTLRLGRHSHYRDLFERQQDEWIGDGSEGISTLRQTTPIVFRGKPTPDQVAAAARAGIYIEGAIDGYIAGNRSIRRFDDFMFCAATGDLEVLTEAMCSRSESNPNPYNACIEIVDPDLLAALMSSAQYRCSDTNRIIELRPIPFRKVEYVDGARDPSAFDHSPYTKRKKFAAQSEIRMLFKGDVHPDIKVASATVPGLRMCLRRLF